MFKDNTVFVIGAGASAEFGLPVGWELTQTIRENCLIPDAYTSIKRPPNKIWNFLKDKYRDQKDRYSASADALNQIRNGIDSAESIDEYVFRYSDNELIAEIAKLQIAYAISKSESKSALFESDRQKPDISKVDTSWIWQFWKSLIRGIKATELDKIGQNITIICFNYDRCIEHYFEHALNRSFPEVSVEDARKIIKQIEILHPYGKLGELDRFPFGHINNFADMTENLVTWSEAVREPDTITSMKRAIKEAKQVVFMGFGFAKQNMDLLTVEERKKSVYGKPKFYATALGYTKAVQDSLSEKIEGIYSEPSFEKLYPQMQLDYASTCTEFFSLNRMNFEQ